MTPDPTSPLDDHAEGCMLHIYANPKASRTQLAGLHGTRLKIQVASPPVDGKANEALVAFLAKTLGISKSNVTLKSGHTGKRKTFLLVDVTRQEARTALKLTDDH